MRAVQRTWAHAVVRDGAGRVLLVPATAGSPLAGRWILPGTRVRHGEHPRDAVLRELTTIGLSAVATRPAAASSDLVQLSDRQVSLHTIRLVYDAEIGPPGPVPAAGPARPVSEQVSEAQPGGGRFVRAGEAVELALAPFVAEVLGLPEPAPLNPGPARLIPPAHDHDDLDDVRPVPGPPVPGPPVSGRPGSGSPRPGPPMPGRPVPGPPTPGPPVPGPPTPGPMVPGPTVPGPGRARPGEVAVPLQRPAAYAVLVDGYTGPESRGRARMLLTRLAGSERTWTLPGGGVDHGEHPLVALVRELWEEAGLPYTVGPLIDIGSRHFVGRAPDGRLEDFQGIRLIYAGSVPTDRTPTVVEVNGSTDATAWIPLDDLERVGAVPTVREALARWIDLADRGDLRDAG